MSDHDATSDVALQQRYALKYKRHVGHEKRAISNF